MTEKNNKNSRNKGNKRGNYLKNDIVHSGDKINAFVSAIEKFRDRSELKKRIVESLGYKYDGANSKERYSSAYTRIKNQNTFLGVTGLTQVAEVLGVDWFDILDDKYQDSISTIKIIKFSDEHKLNEYLYRIETKNDFGRIGVFNRFPSLIYFNENVEWRNERYKYLTGKANRNDEYYSLRSVLDFGFTPFSEFTRSEKVNILDTIISAHGSTDHTINLIDNTKISYPRTSSECEIIGKDLILMQAPYFSNSLLSIRSKILVRILKEQGIGNHMDGIHYHSRTMKFLEIMRDSLGDGGDALEFISALKARESSLANSVESLFSKE